ncbi:hypothetical protein [Methyloferula stellata]|uniref:hypothetical protein n=1 Tax=Methyloferula stellata TaxID=876270 RepID=UPI000365AD9F|nr:hypothetical protein [Methyloferula stellata]
MIKMRHLAGLPAFCFAIFGLAAFNPVLAQNSSVSIDAPAATKPPAKHAQKPKAAPHAQKQDISDIEKKPASTSIPMDFSYIKKPGDSQSETSSSSKSEFDGPIKPTVGPGGGGMNFKW